MSGLQGQVLGHLVRRGVEYANANTASESSINGWEELKYEMPPWGAVILYATALFFAFAVFTVRYSVGHVVATLAMIESPATQTVSHTKVSYSDDPDATIEKAPLLEIEETVHAVPTKIVTTNIRATIKHITSQGGRTMRFRGLGMAMVYELFTFWLSSFLMHIIPGARYTHAPIKASFVAGITGVALCKVHALYTHVTVTPRWGISMKEYCKQYGHRLSWRQLALPAFGTAMVMESSAQLLQVVYNMTRIDENTSAKSAGAQIGAVVLTTLFVVFVLAIPAMIRLRRLEASLIPEEIETLVPFDRSFGGKVDPADVTSSPFIRMRAARKSFSCAIYRRVLGVYAKMAAMVMAITFVGVHVVFAEAYLIMGDALRQLALAVHAHVAEHIAEKGYKL